MTVDQGLEAGLHVELESPLPASLPAGRATAVFCFGTCFHRSEAMRGLEILVDGARHPPTAFGMPRLDVFRRDPGPRSYRSGFWATVPIEARERPGNVELRAAARLASGDELLAPLGRIEVVEREPPTSSDGRPEPDGQGLIAICMTTYEPDIGLFRGQIESLRAQTDQSWICLISDDCTSLERFEQIRQTLGADPRFLLSRSARRLGFYRNFERALRMVPPEAELVALCDQDDRWYPEKLQVLRETLGEAVLVYSDQRLVDADGSVLRETLWKGRRNNHTNLASLLIANTITGAATLFRREVAELARPFPDTPGLQFHDHWLGLVAMAMGDVAYVDRPLYDYVQHAGAIFGEVTQEAKPSPPRRRFRGLLGRWRAAYFYGYLAREVQAQVLLARCSSRLTAPKRRALKRYIASGRSAAGFAWLATRSLRGLLGLNETLGSEGQLAQGVLWRWLIVLRARRPESAREGTADAGFPDAGPESFEQTRLRRWRARA